MRRSLVFLAIVFAIVCLPLSQASLIPPAVPKPATVQEIAARDIATVLGMPYCPGVVRLRENGTYVVINLGALKRVSQFIPSKGKKGPGFLRLISVRGQTLDVTSSIDDIVHQLDDCKKGKSQ